MKVFTLYCLFIFYWFEIFLAKENTTTEKWETFKKMFNKTYTTILEESFRKSLFLKQLQEVEEHNIRYAKKLVTYKIGINKFSDLSDKEIFRYIHGVKIPTKTTRPKSKNIRSKKIDLPASVDWRKQGVVGPVKNQGSCGSCWAFSANGALECHYAIYKNQTVALSEQQLVDCVKENDGCDGGWMNAAYDYIKENGGVNREQDYPYEACDGECRYHADDPHYTVSGHTDLEYGNEENLQETVAFKGPVAVAVDATGHFASYQNGVYYNPTCDPDFLIHAMVVVGYGSEDGHDYWLVKNSFGNQWGDRGYIKMARNSNNHCGIASAASYPILD